MKDIVEPIEDSEDSIEDSEKSIEESVEPIEESIEPPKKAKTKHVMTEARLSQLKFARERAYELRKQLKETNPPKKPKEPKKSKLELKIENQKLKELFALPVSTEQTKIKEIEPEPKTVPEIKETVPEIKETVPEIKEIKKNITSILKIGKFYYV
jgi:transposase